MSSCSNVQDLLRIAIDRYTTNNPNSQQLHQDATQHLPGGNTRSVLHNDPFPLSLLRGHGSFVYDEDNHQYLDFLGEMSAGLYGHSHPTIIQSVNHVCNEIGLSLGGTTRYELDLANELSHRWPAMVNVRFCNSGTELNIQCLIAAKYHTKKTKFICFQGAYHGGPLGFGHGVSDYNINHDDFIVCKYNDITDFSTTFDKNMDSLAGVIVEGMLGAGGCIPGDVSFLHNIQERCIKSQKSDDGGVLFILDEVMTSRLSYGGLQRKLDLKPDLVSLGKYIGGGFTFGAFGGRLDIMSCFDPSSLMCLSHSGTFNNNTMTMYVGLQGLQKIYTREISELLNTTGDKLRIRLSNSMKGTKMCVNGLGSSMNIHFTEDGECSDAIKVMDSSISDLKHLFWFDMIERGYWIANRGMINLNVVLTEEDVEEFAQTVENWIEQNKVYITL